MRLLSTELLKDSIKSVQAVSNNPIEFHDLITYELLHKEMTIFTPKMDVILLPEGATVIDFAFSLNPELAKKMSYVKINGQTKSITTALNNMDIVEIIALKRNTVHADWLNHAQTSKAMKTIQDSLQ
ncbi:TGS domain-containing protein [Neobacillus mesonae]|nr:TGS domain-containing protein [Neobacillus mesonae]